jgi:hypothetical protein
MLVETIAFRIFDRNSGTDNEYVIENTSDNQEMVFSNHYTHAIEFGQMFDFQFAHEECEPKFIQFGNAFAKAWDKEENHLDISDVDEMVGCDY